jgi:hypothetical protein
MFILGLIGISSGFYFTRNVTKVADQFIDYIANDYPDKAYDLLSLSVKDELTYDHFIGLLTSSLSAKPQPEIFWTNRSVSNGIGAVEGTMTLENDHKVVIELELKKEVGEWKISFLGFTPQFENQ